MIDMPVLMELLLQYPAAQYVVDLVQQHPTVTKGVVAYILFPGSIPATIFGLVAGMKWFTAYLKPT